MHASKSRNLILLAALLLLVVVLAPIPHDSIATEVLHDFGHAPIFGGIAIIALFALREHKPAMQPGRQYIYAFAISAGLGVLTEILQIPVGRQPSWLDIASDILGAFGFLALFFALIDRRCHGRGLHFAAGVLGVAALGVHSWPLAHTTLSYVQRDARFPVLFDARQIYDDFFLYYFEATGDHVELPAPYAQFAGERALLLELQQRWSPSMAIVEPGPDWRHYRVLALDLTNASNKALAIKVAVRDRHYDETSQTEFRRPVTLSPMRRETVRIAFSDLKSGSRPPLDLENVRAVAILDEHTKEARAFYVSRIWLER